MQRIEHAVKGAGDNAAGAFKKMDKAVTAAGDNAAGALRKMDQGAHIMEEGAQLLAKGAKAVAKEAKSKVDEATNMIAEDTDKFAKKRGYRYDRAKINAITWLCIYSLFLGTFIAVVFLPNDINEGYNMTGMANAGLLSQEVSVYTTWNDVTDIEGVYDFLRAILIPAAFSMTYYNGALHWPEDKSDRSRSEFMLDSNLVLGAIRVRQLRVKAGSCHVPNSISTIVTSTCNAPYSEHVLDEGPFYFKNKTSSATHAQAFNSTFFSKKEIGSAGSPAVSTLTGTRYMSGGFIEDLPTEKISDALTKVQLLQDNLWVDNLTRALFLEVSVYSSSIDQFSHMRFSAEQLPSGAIVTGSRFSSGSLLQLLRSIQKDGTSALYKATFGLMIVLYAFVLIFLVRMADDVINDWDTFWRFILNGYNLFDVGMVVLILTNLCVTVVWMLEAANIKYIADIEVQDSQRDDMHYFKVLGTLEKYELARLCLACSILLAFFKGFKFIGFTPSLQALARTLEIATAEMTALVFVITIIFISFGAAFTMAFGTSLVEYREFSESFMSVWLMMLGIFDLNELRHANPALGVILFISYMILAKFVVLSLLLKIVDVAFAKVMEDIRNIAATDMRKEFGLAFQAVLHDAFWRYKVKRTLIEAALYEKLVQIRTKLHLDRDSSDPELGQVPNAYTKLEETKHDLLDELPITNLNITTEGSPSGGSDDMLKTLSRSGVLQKAESALAKRGLDINTMTEEDATDALFMEHLTLLAQRQHVLDKLSVKLTGTIADFCRYRRAVVLSRKHTEKENEKKRANK